MYDFSLSNKKQFVDTYIMTFLSQSFDRRKVFSKTALGQVRCTRGGDHPRGGTGTDPDFNHVHPSQIPLCSPYLTGSCLYLRS